MAASKARRGRDWAWRRRDFQGFQDWCGCRDASGEEFSTGSLPKCRSNAADQHHSMRRSRASISSKTTTKAQTVRSRTAGNSADRIAAGGMRGNDRQLRQVTVPACRFCTVSGRSSASTRWRLRPRVPVCWRLHAPKPCRCCPRCTHRWQGVAYQHRHPLRRHNTDRAK